MSSPWQAGDDLSTLGLIELEQAYVESVQAAEATEHVGRKNRLARHRWKIAQELEARGEDRAVFRRLAGHSDESVRAAATGYLNWLDKPRSEPVRRRPLRPEILWQCDHPAPAALAREEIAERLRQSLPEFCDALMDLALPAIGLWPQRRADIAATATRFGGTPSAPPDWQWPIAEEEPLLFVGQINCAELRGLPGAEVLPSAGLLAFFGDHDAVTGCCPFDAGGVYFWPDVDRLARAKASIDPLEVFPSCALVPRPMLDLPHPFSRAVGDLDLNEDQRQCYFDVWQDVLNHSIPPDCAAYAKFSKLLGWPNLVQSDLERFDVGDDARLLLQVNSYCNGEQLHGWGPGGSLFMCFPSKTCARAVTTAANLKVSSRNQRGTANVARMERSNSGRSLSELQSRISLNFLRATGTSAHPPVVCRPIRADVRRYLYIHAGRSFLKASPSRSRAVLPRTHMYQIVRASSATREPSCRRRVPRAAAPLE